MELRMKDYLLDYKSVIYICFYTKDSFNRCHSFSDNDPMSKILSLPLDDYIKILINNGAFNTYCGYFFNNMILGTFYLCLINKNIVLALLDHDIVKKTNIPLHIYSNILKNNGAFEFNTNFYFKTKQEAQRAIEELEPHLIMAKLSNIGE